MQVKRVLLLNLCGCFVLMTGCASQRHLVHFRTNETFNPDSGAAMLDELNQGLVTDVVSKNFFFNQRKTEWRGTVLVQNVEAMEVLVAALQANLKLGVVLTEKADAGGKTVVCFSSCAPFEPEHKEQLLAELKGGLHFCSPQVIKTRKKNDGMVAWVVVKGNLGKAETKFAIRQNPNLTLLQVERWNLATQFALLFHPR